MISTDYGDNTHKKKILAKDKNIQKIQQLRGMSQNINLSEQHVQKPQRYIQNNFKSQIQGAQK